MSRPPATKPLFDTRPYFLGKMLWEKGYGKLWDLLEGYQAAQNQQGIEASSPATSAERKTAAGDHQAHATPAGDKVDAGDGGIILSAYGSGPDSDPIRERAAVMGLSVEFNPATDHAELSQYKTFVNPSESEVLCTTVAEALAMGKFVVIAEHASNEFFYQFPNTLKFKSQEEFNEQVQGGVCVYS